MVACSDKNCVIQQHTSLRFPTSVWALVAAARQDQDPEQNNSSHSDKRYKPGFRHPVNQ